MKNVPEFIKDDMNVYRTKYFIVKQNVSVCSDETDGISVVSADTFYVRTRVRDKVYEEFFRKRKNINGKRIPTTMYSRNYIE